ncbi:MAG: DegV family protein [Clostridia bacterium]|nr:DegV family protein [Clostridia bacterium]
MSAKKIAIVTDSNSGIMPNDAPEGVFVVPMPFLVNGENYFENVTIFQKEFYEQLETANVSTSQPSIGDISDLWTDILKDYDEIVHIPMTSGLSNSCATAQNLAKDFDGRVFVVDNHRISATMKESVYDALKLAKQGKNGAEIQEYLETTAFDGSIYIAVSTMKYLKKGGRVTPAAAMIGSILKLNPVLQIQGEKLDKYALARGSAKAKETIKSAIKHDLEVTYAEYVKNGEMALHVAHTANDAAAEALAKELQEMFPNIPFHYCDPLAMSIACHTGPGALGAAVTRFIKE